MDFPGGEYAVQPLEYAQNNQRYDFSPAQSYPFPGFGPPPPPDFAGFYPWQ